MSNECKKFTGAELKIGMTAERSKTITKKDIEYFGIVSTDTNPMHFDEAYASKTQFGRCIAHGVISLSLCGSVLGMELPRSWYHSHGSGSHFQKARISR